MLTGESDTRRRPYGANIRTVLYSRVTDELHLSDPNVDPIVKVLIKLRMEANLTAETLSQRSFRLGGLSLSPTAFRKWERGASSPSLKYLRRWCQLLGKDLEQIVKMVGQS